MPKITSSPDFDRPKTSVHPNEAGYTLVALIALMTVMALFAMAAAPRIAQQAQREREQEAIFRGEEVADAIRLYYKAALSTNRIPGDTALPTDMDQLLEGVQIRGRVKKMQILRVSAARDPLSRTGEWRFIRPHSPEIADFVQDLMLYTKNTPPITRDPDLQRAQQNMAPILTSVNGLAPSRGSSGLSSNASGPFIGVSSSSGLESVITYYGIDRHDRWVFTPLFR